MNHWLTNLHKAFNTALYCVVILSVITGCGNPGNNSEPTDTPIFIGEWKIKSIRPAKFIHYSAEQQEKYIEQMNMLLDSSYANFNKDSTYQMLTGDYAEKGKWLVTQKQDKLVLKAEKDIVNRFLILEQTIAKLTLQNIDTGDSLIMELERKTSN
jgi:hypothetical protein